MIEEWKEALDNGKMAGTVAVDLSKTFDSLNFGLLIAELMDNKSCKLISSFLLIVIRESRLVLVIVTEANLRVTYSTDLYWPPSFK